MSSKLTKTWPATRTVNKVNSISRGVAQDMYRRWGSLIAVSIVLCVGIVGSGCLGGGGGGGGGPTGKFNVGVILSLTGSLSIISKVIMMGIELSASDINAAGGVGGKRVNLIFKDDKLDEPTGTSVYNELLGENVKGIVGPVPSTITLQVILANEQEPDANKVVIVSPSSTAAELSGKSQYFLRTVPFDTIQAPNAADVVVNKLQKKRVALLYQSDIYGNGLRQDFDKRLVALNGTVVAEEAFSIGQTSFSAQVSSIILASPDVVFVPGFYREQILGIRELRGQGYTGQILASEAIENDDIFQMGGSALKDLLFMKAAVEPNRSAHKHFVANYTAKYGTNPGAYADYAYDALRVLIDTLIAKGLNATSAQMKDYMHQTTFTDTATRDIKFDGNGDLIGGSYVPYRIQCNDTSCTNGSFVPFP